MSLACQKALLAKLVSPDAKAAVRAVVAIFGRDGAAERLGATVNRLVDSLALPGSEKAAVQLEAALAAVSMAVRLLPQVGAEQLSRNSVLIFPGHAPRFAEFAVRTWSRAHVCVTATARSLVTTAPGTG